MSATSRACRAHPATSPSSLPRAYLIAAWCCRSVSVSFSKVHEHDTRDLLRNTKMLGGKLLPWNLSLQKRPCRQRRARVVFDDAQINGQRACNTTPVTGRQTGRLSTSFSIDTVRRRTWLLRARSSADDANKSRSRPLSRPHSTTQTPTSSPGSSPTRAIS